MRREVSICFGLAAITLAVFWPIGGHDFINLDDPDYVTGNLIVQAAMTWPGVQWAFGNHANNWHPLTWLSHMLDCQVFGLKPGAHHLVSLGFHIASSLLLFLTLKRMTGTMWRNALVAGNASVTAGNWLSETPSFFSCAVCMGCAIYITDRKSVV